MGVYIKDMEIPKSCRDCDIGFTICNRYYDPNFGINDARIKRHPDCPLVEVKAPHGRLGDLDALRARMYHEAFETDSDMQRWESGCWIRYKLFERTEEAAPTVLEAEEKDDG